MGKVHPLIRVDDINYRAFSYISDQPPPSDTQLYFFLAGRKECEARSMKRARCCGYVHKQYPVPGKEHLRKYVVFYEPVSEFHRYMVDHYVLHETVA